MLSKMERVFFRVTFSFKSRAPNKMASVKGFHQKSDEFSYLTTSTSIEESVKIEESRVGVSYPFIFVSIHFGIRSNVPVDFHLQLVYNFSKWNILIPSYRCGGS